MTEPRPAPPRDDVEALIPYARERLAAGDALADVLTSVYGADLPRETYAYYRFHREGPDLPLFILYHPWAFLQLVDPRPPMSGSIEREKAMERRAYQRDPDYVPLLQLDFEGGLYEEQLIGYRSSLLKQGDTTISAYDESVAGPEAFVVVGRSLVDVMIDWITDYRRIVRDSLASTDRRIAERYFPSDVDDANLALEKLERMRTG